MGKPKLSFHIPGCVISITHSLSHMKLCNPVEHLYSLKIYEASCIPGRCVDTSIVIVGSILGNGTHFPKPFL